MSNRFLFDVQFQDSDQMDWVASPSEQVPVFRTHLRLPRRLAVAIASVWGGGEFRHQSRTVAGLYNFSGEATTHPR